MRAELLAVLLCFASVGCGGDGTPDAPATTPGSTSSGTSATTDASSTGVDPVTSTGDATGAAQTSTSGAPEPEPTRVLFIGNSYTFVNDLPGMIEGVAEGAGQPLDTAMVAVGGARLSDHVVNPDVADALDQGWDVVVIQGQSVEPVVDHDGFVQAAVELSAMVSSTNPAAALLLYETWARRAGDPLLDDLGMTAEQMQAALTAGYADAAAATMGAVAPVGQTWALALADAPQIGLFASDGSHPSRAGTYLASCVFFRALTGADAAILETPVDGLDDADADTIESIADALAP
ncbi:MAG: hypothetical protein K1X88_08535 [Nannocystaceae bacterium]|nr:hypothetical protein [Nannocystaceae bacterium]